MRIPANEVERQLVLATEEAAAEHLPVSQRTARVEELMEAHQAAERRQPFGRANVRGRKDGVLREIVTTGETVVGKNGAAYRRCLVPYTGAQELHRRRTRHEYRYRRGLDKKGPWTRARPQVGKDEQVDVKAFLPYHFHDQIIAESRLER